MNSYRRNAASFSKKFFVVHGAAPAMGTNSTFFIGTAVDNLRRQDRSPRAAIGADSLQEAPAPGEMESYRDCNGIPGRGDEEKRAGALNSGEVSFALPGFLSLMAGLITPRLDLPDGKRILFLKRL